MTMRRAAAPLVLIACLSLAACASSGTRDVPAAERSHPAWLIGTWRGSAWETAAATGQGQQTVVVTFANDGAWKTEAGGSGTSWVVDDRVVLEGRTADGAPIRYTFKQREAGTAHELWGVVQARFGTAAVNVKRMP